MSAKNIILWVSSLALVALTASCSGMAGSPIQSDLDASANSDQSAAQATDEQIELPGFSTEMPQGDGKGVSYTPGLACPIPGGMSFPSVLNYGWKNGIVTEGALAPSVSMTSAAGTPLAWIAYAYKELAAGRLQDVKIEGQGKQMAVFMYNWNSPSWGYFGTYDLFPGAPVNIPVGPDYAPNGVTFVILVQLPTYTTTITKIQTDVF